jgi:hypothetical protein
MSNEIHAVLDEESEAIRKRLNAEGWTDSEIVHRAIRALAASTQQKRQFTGVGNMIQGLPISRPTRSTWTVWASRNEMSRQ